MTRIERKGDWLDRFYNRLQKRFQRREANWTAYYAKQELDSNGREKRSVGKEGQQSNNQVETLRKHMESS